MIPRILGNVLDRIIPSIALDQKLFFLCLLSSYGFSYLYFETFIRPKRDDPKYSIWKHVYIILVANLFIAICFKWTAFIHIYTPVLFTYTLLKGFGAQRFGKNLPIFIFVSLLIHLSAHHILRQLSSYGAYTLDHSTLLMMLCIKLSTFAFEVCDEKTTHDFSLPEFLGFALLFPGLLSGPCISFDEYHEFINGHLFKNVRSHQGRRKHAFKLFLASLLVLALYVGLQKQFTASAILDPSYTALPLWRQWIGIHLYQLVWRSKYYIAWLNAEGAYAIIGLGINKGAAEGNYKWNRVQNVRPLQVEFSADPRQIVTDWNITTNQWLRGCVYKRLGIHQHGTEGKPGFRVSLATYFVSAFWHGFYPGYYLTFGTMALLSYFSRLVYRNFSWPFAPWLRPMVLYIPVFTLLNYVTIPFSLQELGAALRFYKRYYYFGHVFLIAGILVLRHAFPVGKASRQKTHPN